MIRITYKCPDCGAKPWIRPSQFNDFIMGCCGMYARHKTERQTRSTWNEMTKAKFDALAQKSAVSGVDAALLPMIQSRFLVGS
jgi:hypothetical protein